MLIDPDHVDYNFLYEDRYQQSNNLSRLLEGRGQQERRSCWILLHDEKNYFRSIGFPQVYFPPFIPINYRAGRISELQSYLPASLDLYSGALSATFKVRYKEDGKNAT